MPCIEFNSWREPVPFNRELLENIIVEASSLLDEERFEDWISLCAPEFEYKITAFSDELGTKMHWMHQGRDALANLLANVRFHERNPGRIRRHLGAMRLIETGDAHARTESSVTLWHTDEQGTTQLFAVGKYIDQFVATDSTVLFANREVALDTRRLPFGSHVPL